MTTERHITAQWVASFLTSPRADGVWLPHHPSNWKAVGAPDHDLLHGWTSPVTPTAGAWAGQVVVKFCPQVIASAAQQLPFSPKEQYGFRKTKSGDNPMWTADNYVRAIKRIIDHELSGASRQDAEDALYDEAPQVFAVATEVQMMTLDSANNPTRRH